MPDLRLHSETWTRESHGLYDFLGEEVEKHDKLMKGTHLIHRNEFTISCE